MVPKKEFVISGLSGRFPESENLEDFWNNLIQGKDMITEDNRRWDIDAFKMPRRMGKIPQVDKFDADFFGVPGKLAHMMDPRTRILLEVTYEAIVDAGVNPKAIQGTTTGVFVCGTLSESFDIWARTGEEPNVQLMPAAYPCMIANRISYAFNFQGPSVMVETGCSSSFIALNDAILALRSGQCDAAIVAGGNINLSPSISLAMTKYNMLSVTGKCRTFDADCGGYVRSEAVVAVYICRKDAAKRSYATVVGVRSNSDGYKTEGPSFPSKLTQIKLLTELYAEVNVNPLDVSYIEAHGTGTKAGDPEEIHALAEVFCKDRTGPLLVGSAKTNMGHAECVSGLCGLAKVVLSRLSGILPPNLHYENPNPELTAIINGRIQVVTRPIPFKPVYVGINSFGYGGSNTHVLLKFSEDEESQNAFEQTIPKIIFASGRTQEAVQLYLEKAVNLAGNSDFLSLLHEITKTETPRHLFCGYAISKGGKREIVAEEKNSKTSVWFVYTGLGSQWVGMVKDMKKFKAFEDSINKSLDIMSNNGFDLKSLLETSDLNLLNNLKNALVSITSMQIALTDILDTLGIVPDGIIGHSNGECACAYADKCLTQEQTLLVSLSKARGFLETNLQAGTLASIGLSQEELNIKCPADIYPAIYNTENNITVSGPLESIQAFVKELKAEGYFAKEVTSAMYGFHSPYVYESKPLMLKLIKEIVPEPKLRSEKWLSSSVQESEWESDLARYCSAEYHTNNAVSPVLLYQTLQHIPDNGVVLEVSPHCFLQSILKESLKSKTVQMGVMNCKCEDNKVFFLQTMGKLFLSGISANIPALYGNVKFPVSGKTPAISPMIVWDHSVSWNVPNYKEELSSGKGTKYSINTSNTDTEYLNGHALQGKVVFPATGYIWLVWKTLAKQRNIAFDQLPVCFENVFFKRSTELLQNDNVNFIVSILPETGHFEVTEGQEIVCHGTVRPLSTQVAKQEMFQLKPPQTTTNNVFLKEGFYTMLNLRGYEYRDQFQGVNKIDMAGHWAELHWNNNWVCFLDTMLQTALPAIVVKGLSVPVRLEEAVFDPELFLTETNTNQGLVLTNICEHLDVTQCPGLQLRGIKFSGISSIQASEKRNPTIFEQTFVPYFEAPNTTTSKETTIELFLGIAIDNTFGKAFVASEILQSSEPLCIDSRLKTLTATTIDSLQHRVVTSYYLENSGSDKSITQYFDSISDLKNLSKSQFVFTDNEYLISSCEELVAEMGFLATFNTPSGDLNQKFVLVAEKFTDSGRFSLYRNMPTKIKKNAVISLDVPGYAWIETLQNKLIASEDDNSKITIITTSVNSGIVGFTKCLIKEPCGYRIRSFQVFGVVATVNHADDIGDSQLVKSQMEKDLVFNIYREGAWGCLTNLTVPLLSLETRRPCSEVYADIQTYGDLSSLRWIDSPCKLKRTNEYKIHYSALNFKDIMHASGKLSKSTLPEELHSESCILGFEFSGTIKDKKICGLAPNKCLATALENKPSMVWDVPDDWSLAEAATVPAVYATALYGLIVRAGLKTNETVLIHSGSGGVGLAAITIALSMNCKVFTTVGSQNKREILTSRFPQLDPSQISDSRNARTFEKDVLMGTQGKGVDVVLNSLAEEKLQASIRCLAKNGRFIEIGKYDVLNNSPLGMSVLLKSVNIQGIYLDALMVTESEERTHLQNLMEEFIQKRVVKPLPYTSFEQDDLEGAFRFLASGKHIGKILVKVRENSEPVSIASLPRTYFHMDKTYVVIGGLGGMGLEVIDWMVERCAREIFIVSRCGIKNSYQENMVRKWREIGANIYLKNIDVSDMNQVCTLLLDVIAIGPIGGIFNLALILEDALFQNQNMEKFQALEKGKAIATMHFDVLSRQLAPNIDHFVVFSSIVANRGNEGQSNYGFANSVMERICDQRKSEGLPSLAIQWGLVGDVGYTADLFKGKKVIMGIEPQGIVSCINTLDLLLQQNRSVVNCFVTAVDEEASVPTNTVTSLPDIGARILGIQDLSKVDENATLNEMGMDSIMATELKTALQTKMNIVLPSQGYGKLTFKSLLDMQIPHAIEATES